MFYTDVQNSWDWFVGQVSTKRGKGLVPSSGPTASDQSCKLLIRHFLLSILYGLNFCSRSCLSASKVGLVHPKNTN